MVESYCETLQDSEEYDHAERNKELIWQHIFIVAPKIIGAASVTDYVHKMENASIVRYNCRELMEQIQFTAIVGAGEQKYADTIEREMQDFKVLFRKWVSTFEHDGYEDEWGLFT